MNGYKPVEPNDRPPMVISLDKNQCPYLGRSFVYGTNPQISQVTCLDFYGDLCPKMNEPRIVNEHCFDLKEGD